jgi:hypothetical protein
MKKSIATGLLLLFLSLPLGAEAQGLGIGARAGFLGFGGEAAVELNRSVVLRGGFGVFPIDFTGEYSGVSYTVTPPSSIGNLGIDLYPGGRGFRIVAGLMSRSGDVELQSGTCRREARCRSETRSTIRPVPSPESSSPSPPHPSWESASGGTRLRGLACSWTSAWLSWVTRRSAWTPPDPIRDVPGFMENLRKEEREIEEVGGGLLKYWPVFSVGIRLGIG